MMVLICGVLKRILNTLEVPTIISYNNIIENQTTTPTQHQE
jgi:hypothetical protein